MCLVDRSTRAEAEQPPPFPKTTNCTPALPCSAACGWWWCACWQVDQEQTKQQHAAAQNKPTTCPRALQPRSTENLRSAYVWRPHANEPGSAKAKASERSSSSRRDTHTLLNRRYLGSCFACTPSISYKSISIPNSQHKRTKHTGGGGRRLRIVGPAQPAAASSSSSRRAQQQAAHKQAVRTHTHTQKQPASHERRREAQEGVRTPSVLAAATGCRPPAALLRMLEIDVESHHVHTKPHPHHFAAARRTRSGSRTWAPSPSRWRGRS